MKCQKCAVEATIEVAVSFTPGGTETIAVCPDHAWDLYRLIAQWYDAMPPQPAVAERVEKQNIDPSPTR